MSQPLKPGSLTVLQSVVLPEGATMRLLEALVAERFIPPLPTQLASSGWSRIDAPDNVDLMSTSAWMLAPWVCLAWRQDEKRVPSGAIGFEVANRLRSWCEANRLERAPASVRDDVRKAVELELTARTPATPVAVGVWWDTSTSLLLVGTNSAKTLHLIRGAWARLMSRLAVGDVPREGPSPEYYPATPALVDALREQEGPFRALTDQDPGNPEERGRLVDPGAFLAWMWHQSETATDGLRTVRLPEGRSISWMVRDGLSLKDASTGKRRMTIRAADAQEDPSIRVAVIDGHAIESVGLHVERDGAWCHDLVLSVDEGDLVLGALKLRKVEGDPLEAAVSMAYALVDVHDSLVEMLGAYGELRADPDRSIQYGGTFRRWLGDEIVGWAGKQLGLHFSEET